jgi:hypothetical protein
MKKKIILGSFFAVAMILVLPSIPAVEFHELEKAYEANFIAELKNIELQDLANWIFKQANNFNNEKINNEQIQYAQNQISLLDFEDGLNELQEKLENENVQPQCIIISLLFLFILIKLVCKVVGSIIGLFFGMVGLILGFIGKIIGFIGGVIGIIFGVFGSIIGWIFGTFARFIGWIVEIIIPG